MKLTNLTIIISLVVFVLGIGLGFIFGVAEKPQIEIQTPLAPAPLTAQEEKVSTILKSATLTGLCANLIGEVVEIGENIIVITRNQERLEVKVELDTHIGRVVAPEIPGGVPTSETINLDQIEIGENAGIYAVITEDGEIVAQGITLLPIN